MKKESVFEKGSIDVDGFVFLKHSVNRTFFFSIPTYCLLNRGRDRDRERYNPNAFREKSDYKPDVKLEYVDEQGRLMNPKEASLGFCLLLYTVQGKLRGEF